MKTSWHEWQWREDCLSGKASGEQQALFEAKLVIDPQFRDDVYWQRVTYSVIRAYQREILRTELKQVHHRLFTEPKHRNFANAIRAFFLK